MHCGLDPGSQHLNDGGSSTGAGLPAASFSVKHVATLSELAGAGSPYVADVFDCLLSPGPCRTLKGLS